MEPPVCERLQANGHQKFLKRRAEASYEAYEALVTHREEDKMALFENLFEEAAGPVVAVGIGALVLAPKLLPVIGRALRPVAKGAIKTGIALYEQTYASVAEATGDLVAEARAELESESQHAPERRARSGRPAAAS
jgi:hypothetical protein